MQMHAYTTDTSDEAAAVQLEGMRRMSPTERANKMCKHSASLRRMGMDAIRRRHPEHDQHEIRLKFIELTYGKELADAVQDHLRQHEGT